jgi:hypothetical protein
MTDPNQSLDALGRAYGTDKASHGHDYLAFYERFFEPIRQDKITLLEVGVLNGASLSVWEDYFPNARIIGADVDNSCRRFARAKVAIEVIDQSNLEDLVELGRRHGPFDIIIDDGSHFWEHQITTLRTLFPFLRNGGYYVVEDLQTNYGALEAKYRGVATQSCAQYLKELVDLRVADDVLDLSTVEDAFLRTYARNIGLICFHKRCCLLQKEYSGRLVSEQPFIAGYENTLPLSLLAHFGAVGDCATTSGALWGLKPAHCVQGFAIASAGVPQLGIEYRARLSDGTWTAWSSAGTYAGTRGKSEDLLGLSVRLAGQHASQLKLAVAGLFGTDPNPVLVGDGEECVRGNHSLSGVQVVVLPR